nr:pyridoxal-phosphate dependent enzyme [Armatimonadota bacterium]
PWMSLLSGPTPVDHWPGPGASRLLIKRDDLADGRYGGNKARKIEFILGDLQAKGRTSLWTVGGLCSNHCTAAAIYGRAAGLDVRLFYLPTPMTLDELELLKVQAFLGSHQRMLPLVGMEEWRLLLKGLQSGGGGPYLVPPGGSSTAGVFGFISAGLELSAQVYSGEVPAPDVLYIAGASLGTVMGLRMGLQLGRLETKVIMVETVTPFWQQARTLLPTPYLAYRRLQRLLTDARSVLPSFRSLAQERDRRFEQLEVGETSPAVERAIVRGREEFGIELDSHFSGKAFAAMLEDLEGGRHAGKTILFWHTHGKTPASLLDDMRKSDVHLPAAVEAAAARNLKR